MGLEGFTHSELTISVEDKGNVANMNWTGKSRDRNPSAVLTPYLVGIAENLAGYELVCNFAELEFMNSSTVPALISFVQTLEKTEVKTMIYYNKGLEWQVASFSALAVIIRFMNNIELEGK